jgi:hypothetical protein
MIIRYNVDIFFISLYNIYVWKTLKNVLLCTCVWKLVKMYEIYDTLMNSFVFVVRAPR